MVKDDTARLVSLLNRVRAFCPVHVQDDIDAEIARRTTSTDDSMRNTCRNCGDYHDLDCAGDVTPKDPQPTA